MTAAAARKLDTFKADIKRLLVEMGLNEAWATELVDDVDRKYVERMFDEGGSPEEVAKEVCCTRAEVEEVTEADDKPSGPSFVVPLPPKALALLDDLVAIGLYGESREEVAALLVNRQMGDFVGAGVLRMNSIRN